MAFRFKSLSLLLFPSYNKEETLNYIAIDECFIIKPKLSYP